LVSDDEVQSNVVTKEGNLMAETEAFVGRLFEAALSAFDLMTVYIGDRLGLYPLLAKLGPLTPDELAAKAGVHPRYAREWLEQQAVTGILDVDDSSKEAKERRYSLPEAHAEALNDLDSLLSITPVARTVVSAAQTLPSLLKAYRTGEGVPWEAYGADMIESQGDFNRPWLVNQLGSEFLPSLPDVHKRLLADPPARVADVACGVGWAAIAIAKAYPKVRVEGFDPDPGSIDIARRLSREAEVDDRVSFEVREGAALGSQGPYDLAIVIESIHDMARPIEVLDSIRQSLASGATLLVADERVADAFTAPGDEIERFMYAASVLICLPGGLADPPSAGTGTVMRSGTLREYAMQAGFKDMDVLPFEPGFLRFYRFTP
jgi:2-polyprenyl-3-methyl-5-hydroxy-6-metoxy-1,4-benzoquinol methylase